MGIFSVVLFGLAILVGAGVGYFVWHDCQEQKSWSDEKKKEACIVAPKHPIAYSIFCGLLVAVVFYATAYSIVNAVIK